MAYRDISFLDVYTSLAYPSQKKNTAMVRYSKHPSLSFLDSLALNIPLENCQ